MTGDIRVGQSVWAFGRVTGMTEINSTIFARVEFDNSGGCTAMLPFDALTPNTPTEPPVGSVVVYGGKAWTRFNRGWASADDLRMNDTHWPVLSSGTLIFTPEVSA